MKFVWASVTKPSSNITYLLRQYRLVRPEKNCALICWKKQKAYINFSMFLTSDILTQFQKIGTK